MKESSGTSINPHPAARYAKTPTLPVVGWRVAGFAIVLASIVTFLWTPLNNDSAWYLHAAASVLDGARLYRDIVEVNPPLIVYLSLPPVWAARLLGVSPISCFKVGMLGLMITSLLLSTRLTRKLFDGDSRHLREPIDLALVFILFPFAFTSFGQREHILLVLLTPYVLLGIARLKRCSINGPMAGLAGLAAGLGIGLKPHFLLPWVALEFYLVIIRRLDWGAGRPEFPASAVSLLAYNGYVVALSGYPAVAAIALRVYGAYHSDFHSLLIYPGNVVWIGGTLLALLLRSSCEHREDRTVLLIACLGLFCGGFLQHKAWRYHFYPAEAFGILLIVLVVLSTDRGPFLTSLGRYRQRVAWLVFAGILCVSAVLLGYVVGPYRVGYARDINGWVALVRKHSGGRPVLFLSTSVYPAFPVVNYSDSQWPSRFNCLWFLPGLYADRPTPPGRPFVYRRPDQMSPLERGLMQDFISDLLKNPPGLIISNSWEEKQGFGRTSFDFVDYFSMDPEFRSLFINYEEIGKRHSHRIFARK